MNTFYFDNTNGILTLRSRALDEAGFKKHCFTTRMGGVSEGHLASTNMSFSRECFENVDKNYSLVANAVGFSGEHFVLTNQQHTANVFDIKSTTDNKYEVLKDASDGLVSAVKGVCLCVFVADCVPILIADKKTRTVSAVHSGWRGTAARISAAAVEMMKKSYGADPRDMIAVIGPCINKCCYEVGQDVYDEFVGGAEFFTKKQDGKYLLDLNAANIAVLQSAGVGEIHASYECTYCKPDIYYSHRYTKGKRGNLAAMIEL